MFGLKDSNWYANGIDWVGDAIEAIGYHCGFDEATVFLKVKNFRVAIPSNMESIDYIKFNGHRLPLGVDESDYGFVRMHTDVQKPNILNYDERLSLGKLIDNLNALRELDPHTPGVLDQIDNALTQIDVLLGSKYLAQHAGEWRHHFYNIESTTQYIKTSFEEGTIEVKCRRFKVDLEGLPLVVNTYKYKECVSWFLMGRLVLSGYPHPELKSFMEINEYWADRLLPQAQNEPKMFSIDQMERYTRRWTSIKKDAYVSQY